MLSSVLLQNFQFTPANMTISINTGVQVKIGRNQASSNIYTGFDRFFVITSEFQGEELEESDPLYENQTFEIKFKLPGVYNIKCVNYTKIKCIVQVIGSEAPHYQIIQEEIYEPSVLKKNSPQKQDQKNKIQSISDRPFRISEQEVQLFFGCEENKKNISDEEDIYVDKVRIQEKQQNQLNSKTQERQTFPEDYKDKHINKYEARSEQRVRTVEEDDEDEQADSLSCFHDFSKDTKNRQQQKMKSRAQYKNTLTALSNTDSLSTYHTWQPQQHQHFNKIETQSNFSEFCDQLPFTCNQQTNKEPQQKGGRKNSDPLIQNVKEETNSPIKKYRFTNKQQEGISENKITQIELINEQDSSDKTAQKSSESDKEKEKEGTLIVPMFFSELIKKLSKRRDDFQIIPLKQDEWRETNYLYQSAIYYLDNDFAFQSIFKGT